MAIRSSGQLVLVWLLSLPLSACGAPHISGTYVSMRQDGAVLLQVIETPDRQLTGRLESYTTTPDGVIANNTVTISGAADGSELTLLLRPVAFVDAGVSASGSIRGSQLTLSARGRTTTLTRSDAQAYQRAVDAISAHASTARIAKVARDREAQTAAADAKLLADLGGFEPRITAFEAGLDNVLIRVKGYQDRMHVISGKMQTLLQQELATTRSGEPRRFQFANTIRTGVTAGQSVAGDVEALVDQGKAANDQIKSDWASLFSRCAITANPTVSAKCKSVAAAMDSFAARKVVLNAQLKALGGNLQGELTQQQAISNRADA